MSNWLMQDSAIQGVPNWMTLGAAVGGTLMLIRATTPSVVPDIWPAPKPGPKPDLAPLVSAGQEEMRFLLMELGLDDEWIVFFEATAKGESGFNQFACFGQPTGELALLLGDWREGPGEAAAAAKAYNRSEYLHGCGWGAERYSFGSGGWFAFLPAYGVAAFRHTEYECIDPWQVFGTAPSVVMAVEFARRTMRRDSFKANPTWLNLRVGWGNPSAMNKPDALARVRKGKNKFGDRLEQLGYPRSFMDRTVTSLPPQDPAGMLNAIKDY